MNYWYRLVAWVRKWAALWTFLGFAFVWIGLFVLLPALRIVTALNEFPSEGYTLTQMRVDAIKRNVLHSYQLGRSNWRPNRETSTQHLVSIDPVIAKRTGFGQLDGSEERITLPLGYGDVKLGDSLWVYYCPDQSREYVWAWYLRVIPKAVFELRRLAFFLVWGVWFVLLTLLVLGWIYRERIPGWREQIWREQARRACEAALQAPPQPYTGKSKKVRRREARRLVKLTQRTQQPTKREPHK